MSCLPVLKNPASALHQVSAAMPREQITQAESQIFFDDLIITMKAEKGIGIAAPQVGNLLRVIVVDVPEMGPTVYVNPTLTSKSWRRMDSEEGCLSVPGVYGKVRRHLRVGICALDRFGQEVTFHVEGLMSAVFQHEIDHLNGILFIDKIKQGIKAPASIEL